jgi:uncharacterized Fe-S cluster-containing radical SAM superfamily protein
MRILRGLFKALPSPLQCFLARLIPVPPLAKSLPLLSPVVVHIEPTNACNLQCAFCPTADRELLASVQRPSGIMELGVFEKICNDLAAMVKKSGRKISIMHLYKDGEPLLHSEFFAMVAIAKRANITQVVASTTNGLLLNRERVSDLIGSGLDRIRISLKPAEYYAEDKCSDLSKERFGKVLDNIRYLYSENVRTGSKLRIQVQVVHELLDSYPVKLSALRKFADEIDEVNLMGWSLSEMKDFTLGKNPKRSMDGRSPLKNVLVCPEPFSKLAINWNGSVSVCCVDWSWGTVVGDVMHQTIDAIWNGEQLRRFRKTHLEGKRCEIAVCRNCQYVCGTSRKNNIDEIRGRLIQSL